MKDVENEENNSKKNKGFFQTKESPLKNWSEKLKSNMEQMQVQWQENLNKMQKDFQNFTKKLQIGQRSSSFQSNYSSKTEVDSFNSNKTNSVAASIGSSKTASTPNTSTPDSSSTKNNSSNIINKDQDQNSLSPFQIDIREKWNTFLKQSKANLEAWQNNIAILHEQNIEKLKVSKMKMKSSIEEMNNNLKNFFLTQNQAFKENLQNIEKTIEERKLENKEDIEETLTLMNESWTKFIKGQEKNYEEFQKFQNRLWWKGYLNFLLYMILITVIIMGVIYVLKYFGIIQSSSPIILPTNSTFGGN